MTPNTDCFLLYTNLESVEQTVEQLKNEPCCQKIFLLATDPSLKPVDGTTMLYIDRLESSPTITEIARTATAGRIFIYMKDTPLKLSYNTLGRMIEVAEHTGADFIYADHYSVENGVTVKAPCIEYQYGAVRNDFDFGSLILLNTDSVKLYADSNKEKQYEFAAFYDLRLFISRLSRNNIVHVNELLYTEVELDLRKSGEKQFDYVNPNNRNVQIEMEAVATEHLRKIGAYLSDDLISAVSFTDDGFACEASVVIPVKNRARTIADAVRSALSQVTDFNFNVIVVDNHSDDGTTEILRQIACDDNRCIHLIPETSDLGIGGCWNLAANHPSCGRFAVQLDSDDLYSSEHTLQKIIDKFHEDHCAMVIGSYRMCDFGLNTLPPGIIDHKEWTDHNGRNNALRINGLGAPRAFYTPLLRKYGVLNTSYGEDYALGLLFSRMYRIGRIYDELYLCRRWEGNSDAALSREKVNANNFYKDSLRTYEICARKNIVKSVDNAYSDNEFMRFFFRQLREWGEAAERYRQLENVRTRQLLHDDVSIDVQFNPVRIVSTGANISPKAIKERPCFLCKNNRPGVQREITLIGKYELLVNPFPILPVHFTVPLKRHEPQNILHYYHDMMEMAEQLQELFVFYNGPLCGASAPDHMHFQIGKRGVVPFERDWDSTYRQTRSRIYPITDEEFIEITKLENEADDTGIFLARYLCPAFIIITRTPEANEKLFQKLYHAFPAGNDGGEPMMNVMAWNMTAKADGTKRIVAVVIPRKKHRPDCYFQSDERQCMVSPGTLDMGGMIITPRETDFHKMTGKMAAEIIRECGISPTDEMNIVRKLKSKS